MSIANSNSLTLTIDVDDKGTLKVRQFAGEVDKSGKASTAATAAMGRGYDDAGAKLNRLTGLAGNLISALATYKIAQITKDAINAASDLEEMQSKFDVVFKGQEETARAAAEMLNRYYSMSRREAAQNLSGIQDLLVPMGVTREKAALLSAEIVKLSADIGSFNNLPTAQVMADIQSALVGQYETMKKYGVVLNEETVQHQAMNLGLARTKDELSAGMKAYAAFTLMVRDSEAAIGDKQRTMGSYANQLREFEKRTEELSASIGKTFMPMALAMLKVLNDIAEAARRFVAPTPAEMYGRIASDTAADADRWKLIADTYAKTPQLAGAAPGLPKISAAEAERNYREMQRRSYMLREMEEAERARGAGFGVLSSNPGEINVPALGKTDFSDRGLSGADAAAKKALADAKALENEIRKAQDEFELARMGQSRLDEFTAGGQDRNALARMEYERQQTIIAEQNKSWLIQAESDRTNLAAKMAEYEKTYKGILSLTERTAEAMQQNFSNLFFDMMTGKLKSLEDYANAVFQSIARMASDLMAQQVTRSLFGNNLQGGGLLSQLFTTSGANLPINTPGDFASVQPFHSGGLVTGAAGSRMIPAWMIASAPRLHNGLRPDEYPAVLQFGEEVKSRRQVAEDRRAASESKVQVIIQNYTGAQVTQSEQQGPGDMRQIFVMIGNDIQAGGPIARAGEAAYGWRRQGR